jgi:hypothetical protein|tara:strand:+ start:17419 stop:18180 length:762 start_codon:yes stop_codon:yes gene_type:complete
MGKKSSSPPDVSGAAQVEGEFSRETARDVTYADRPDQNNPFGSITWGTEQVRDPASGEMVTKWTQNQGMSEPVQNVFDSQMNTIQSNSDLAGSMSGRIQDEMGSAPEWQQFGDVNEFNYDPTQQRQVAEDAAYERSTNRLDPQFDKKRNDLEIRLRNRGLSAGDQAYQSEMESFSTGRNDAYEQARLGATGEGRQEAQQGYTQALGTNERANALRDQQIAEYISKRGFSRGEQNSVNPIGELTSLSDTVSGGG